MITNFCDLRRLRFSSDADIVRLTNARNIIVGICARIDKMSRKNELRVLVLSEKVFFFFK